MAALLTRDEWLALSRLYIAGAAGIRGNGRGFPAAGAWDVLRALHDFEPTLAREVFRARSDARGGHFIVITEAGTDYYEKHERMYRRFYPPR